MTLVTSEDTGPSPFRNTIIYDFLHYFGTSYSRPMKVDETDDDDNAEAVT